MHGSMMCSRYGSCSWIDKIFNGSWMHGLTSVVVATWEGIRTSRWFPSKEQRFTLRYAFMTCNLYGYYVFDEMFSVF